MALSRAGLLARMAYGGVFVLALPLLLVWWARVTADVVTLPAWQHPAAGVTLVVVGVVVMVTAMSALLVHGDGLPMNAFPPARFVSAGIYRWLANPIYVGFIMSVSGVAIASGSASGLWLVTPVTALCTAALVLGYERHDLRRRFPARPRPRLSLPRSGAEAPSSVERAAVIARVLLPWLVLYEAVHLLGMPAGAIDSHLGFERNWPVWEWTEWIYASAYIVVPAAVLLAPTRTALRRFAILGLIATVAVPLMYVTLPVVSPPRAFVPATFAGRLLAWEQQRSHTVAAFPAFHVIWACITAATLAPRSRMWFRGAWLWTLALATSCVTTGMHSLLDVLFAFVVFAALVQYPAIVRHARALSEHVANSWREWRFGPVRIINHGVFAGAGAAVGVYLAVIVTGGQTIVVLAIALAALVGAGALAQLLEGSTLLLRPFGYYGAIIGGVVCALLSWFVGFPPLLLLGAFALGAPVVQALGRLRCLVQGCCHGALAPAHIGIRYRHGRSRVTQLAHLRGVPLHPTPVYSIVTNLVTGILLLRLYAGGANPALVLGVYFIMNGSARFVEEAYRGEPQTPVVFGMRIYQWLAAVSVLGGIIVTTMHAPVWPAPLPVTSRVAILAALAFGALVTLAMGVDFPGSSRRFSRLALGGTANQARSRRSSTKEATVPTPAWMSSADR